MAKRVIGVVLSVLCALAAAPSISRAGGTDDDGDPLPELAVARLGTSRWR